MVDGHSQKMRASATIYLFRGVGTLKAKIDVIQENS
jgi:hypothetical protein